MLQFQTHYNYMHLDWSRICTSLGVCVCNAASCILLHFMH